MNDRADARYTVSEELANAATHGLGIGLSLLGFAALMIVAPATPSDALLDTASCAIYSVTLVILYTTSTLYHSRFAPRHKKLLRTLDHIAIFLLIAGTYTPFVLITLRGTWGWALFAITWTLAALGVLCELSHLRRFRRLMVALYIGMGWVGLIAIKPLMAALAPTGLLLLFGGGAAYTLGVIFYRMHALRYHHAVWHVFVLAGSALQFFAVLIYVLPHARA